VALWGAISFAVAREEGCRERRMGFVFGKAGGGSRGINKMILNTGWLTFEK
jgi:hypothetical protein